MELEIVKYLRSFESPDEAIDQIKEKYGIHVNSHKDYPNLKQFKYDQINSPMKKQLVQEARGIILDSDNDWNIVAYPFNRFFNYSEGRADKINWSSANVLEKVDGSLMFMYFYNGKWEVASSGLPDASGEVLNNELNYRDLFWRTWDELDYPMPRTNRHTLIFELSTPKNIVVVPQDESMITFIGARDMNLMREVSIDDTYLFPEEWNRPKKYPIKSEEEAVKQCLKMNPMEQEGFVIVDLNFNRVKMKSPAYTAIHHLGLTKEEILAKGMDLSKYDENLQMKWMLKLIVTNEHDEFLSYYPQYEKMYTLLRDKYYRLTGDLEVFYHEVKDIEGQWNFANKVKDHPLSGVFFKHRAGKVSSIEEGIRNTDIKKLLKIVRAY